MTDRDGKPKPEPEDLLQLRPLAIGGTGFGQGKVFGASPSLEDVLLHLYDRLEVWIKDMKGLACKRGKSFRQLLIETHNSQRMRPGIDGTDKTADALCTGGSGPELLRFFIERCPHARDDLLRGELPPYPWHDVLVAQRRPLDPADEPEEETVRPRKLFGLLVLWLVVFSVLELVLVYFAWRLGQGDNLWQKILASGQFFAIPPVVCVGGFLLHSGEAGRRLLKRCRGKD